jgi:hypothetical protein
MVEWLAGNRIRGTSAEKPANNVVPSGGVGGWKEIDRGTGATLDLTSVPYADYYMILLDAGWGGANAGINLIINGDTTSGHYPRNYSYNFGNQANPTTESNVTYDTMGGGTWTGTGWFGVTYIANLASEQSPAKYDMVYNRGGMGAGNKPSYLNGGFCWANTATANRFNFSNQNGSGSLTSDSQVVILGYNPTDTHTTNFWEEIGSTDTLTNGMLDVTIAKKKYLWVQAVWEVATYNNTGSGIRFNNDSSGTDNSSGNYSQRGRQNGNSGDTLETTNRTKIHNTASGGKRQFMNMFITNNATREKLCIIDNVIVGTAANSSIEGVTVAPRKLKNAGKWDNVTDQIERIQILDTSANLVNGSIKIWGSD